MRILVALAFILLSSCGPQDYRPPSGEAGAAVETLWNGGTYSRIYLITFEGHRYILYRQYNGGASMLEIKD